MATKHDFNPLTADIQIKGWTHCAELLVFFPFFIWKGYYSLYEILLQCFLFAFQWVSLQNSNQTKKFFKKFYANFPAGSTTTYAYMSTQHSRGWQHNGICEYVDRALKGLKAVQLLHYSWYSVTKPSPVPLYSYHEITRGQDYGINKYQIHCVQTDSDS